MTLDAGNNPPRGSKEWTAALDRNSREAAAAVDEGRDPTLYLAQLESLGGRRIDPVQFKAQLGPKRGRALRARWRKWITGAALCFCVIAILPLLLVYPLIVGAGRLLGRVGDDRWAEVRRRPWRHVATASRALQALLLPAHRDAVRGPILAILMEESPSLNSGSGNPEMR